MVNRCLSNGKISIHVRQSAQAEGPPISPLNRLIGGPLLFQRQVNVLIYSKFI